MKVLVSLICFSLTVCFGIPVDFSTIDTRLSEIESKPGEKRINQIGWAKDIREAVRFGKELNRPVFVFTHDGRINTGRC